MAQGTSKPVSRIVQAQAVMEGAGVKVHRTIAHHALDYVDPFLLLDEFKSEDPKDYIAGFPWHPHRGIETVTYMINGRVEHGDSVGNSGVIGPGDMQWMTAGKGIIHQEMPKQDNGLLWGLQLWVNLPARDKMCPPRYQEVPAEEIPEETLENGTHVRILCGDYAGKTGPVTHVAVDPLYLDARLPVGERFSHPIEPGYSVFCYCLGGEGLFGSQEKQVGPGRIVIFGEGDTVIVKAPSGDVRFLLVSGRIIGEPIARGGPFVMNTREEIQQAFQEYRNGTFLDH